MLIWYSSRSCVSFGQKCMTLNPGIFSQFSSLPSNVLQKVSYQNVKWLGEGNQISEIMLGEFCPRICISWFSWIDMHSNISNCGKTMKNFGMGSFTCYHRERLWHNVKHTLTKKKCNFPTFLWSEISVFYVYSNIWLWPENSEQFWNGVIKSFVEIKFATKLIYLHCSPKEMQLSTVHFFWDWVYWANFYDFCT